MFFDAMKMHLIVWLLYKVISSLYKTLKSPIDLKFSCKNFTIYMKLDY